jgi:cysteine desulfurase
VFTSGATESNNLALKGLVRGGHVVTVVTEHQAVLEPCQWLEAQGCAVTRLGVDGEGLVDPDAVDQAIRPDTVLVSVMCANNEIGVLQPIAEIGRRARARGLPFHTDAAQAAGKVAIDVEALQVDLLSLTAHKIYGPKGVGALYVRRRGPAAGLVPQSHGGGHERGLRSGTPNVPGIVGFGAAAELAMSRMEADARQLRGLRDRLLEGLRARVPGLLVNGSLERRLDHNLNVTCPGVDGSRLIRALTDLGLSSGAACASSTAEPSHVLRAIGRTEDEAKASLRFGLLRSTTAAEIDLAVGRIAEVVAVLRERPAALR